MRPQSITLAAALAATLSMTLAGCMDYPEVEEPPAPATAPAAAPAVFVPAPPQWRSIIAPAPLKGAGEDGTLLAVDGSAEGYGTTRLHVGKLGPGEYRFRLAVHHSPGEASHLFRAVTEGSGESGGGGETGGRADFLFTPSGEPLRNSGFAEAGVDRGAQTLTLALTLQVPEGQTLTRLLFLPAAGEGAGYSARATGSARLGSFSIQRLERPVN